MIATFPLSFNVVLLQARLDHLRRLAEKNLLSPFGNRGAICVWLAPGIGALRGGALAHCVEPAAEIREGVEVLLLAFPRDNPRIGGDVSNRARVARDEFAPGEAPVQDAIEPVGLLDVALYRVRNLLWRVLHEMVVLPCHGTEPADLPEHPLEHRLAVAEIGGKKRLRLLSKINKNCA